MNNEVSFSSPHSLQALNKVKWLINKVLPKGQFAKGVSVLVTGTASTQLLLLITAPILTRIYSPEDFGLLAVYAGILSTITVIVTLRYELAIPLPEDDKEAASITLLSFGVVVFISSVTAILTFYFSREITQLLNVPKLQPYMWLLPIGVLLSGFYQTLNYWAVRKKYFTDIAKTKVTQSVSQTVIQLTVFKLGALALLIAQVVGQTAGNVRLGLLALKHHKNTFTTLTKQDLKNSLVRWKRFPIYSSWSGLFNTAGSQLPPILFAALFSPVIAGVYLLARRVLQMPMSLLGGAIAQVFFSQSADAKRQGTLAPLVYKIHSRLAKFAMPIMLVLIFAAPKLFALVFGNKWIMAGEFAQWMAPWLYLVFITSPLSQLFSVLEKQSQGLIFQAVLFVVRIGSLLVGSLIGDVLFTVALFSLGSALCWIGFLWWIIKASGNTYADIIKPTIKAFSVSIILVSPLIYSFLVPTSFTVWLTTLLTTGILIAIYYLRMLRKVWN